MPHYYTKLIEKINKSYSEAIRLVRAQGQPNNSKDINTTINLTELAVRRIINFLKLVIDFNDINHELMIMLLKNSMMSLLQIHGVNSYNKNNNTFKEPDTDDTPFSADSLETVYGSEVYQLTISVTQNLCDILYPNKTHIKLLLLIYLFDPLCPNLSTEEIYKVKQYQQKYVKLLYTYFCESLGFERADAAFNRVVYEMNRINELSIWFKSAVDEKSDKDIVRPLMKEIFNMDNGEWSTLKNSNTVSPDCDTPSLNLSMMSSVSSSYVFSNESFIRTPNSNEYS